MPISNAFNVLFNGVSPDPLLFPQSNVIDGFGTFTFTHVHATGTMTTLEFEGRNGPGFDVLDNVAVNEPNSFIGGLLGLVGLCWYQRRRFMRSLSLRSA